jgi:hypothetical protein
MKGRPGISTEKGSKMPGVTGTAAGPVPASPPTPPMAGTIYSRTPPRMVQRPALATDRRRDLAAAGTSLGQGGD